MLRLLFTGLALLCLPHAFAQSSWTPRHGGARGEFLWGITDGAEGPVAVGTNGKILHSPDNHTWLARASGVTDWLVAVAFGAGRYVAVGDRGTILTSIDAVTWTRATSSGTTARLNNVLFAQGKFVAVGEAGVVVTSRDGLTWSAAAMVPPATTQPVPAVGWLRGLAFQMINAESQIGYWIATGQDGAILRSADGLTWARLFGTTLDLEAVASHGAWHDPVYNVNSGALFLAVGAPGAAEGISYDIFTGVSVYRPMRVEAGAQVSGTGSASRLRSLTYGNGVFIATGENGVVLSAPAPQAPWTRVNVGTAANLVNACYVQGTLMLVGEDETILQSEVILTSRLRNVSTRGRVGTGAGALIAGTVVQGSRPKQVLIRAVGPGLTAFGVSGALADPVLRVFDRNNTLVATNSGWTTNLNPGAISGAAAANGAFPLGAGSRDAALLLTLSPGAYTFQVSSASGSAGEALVECYDTDVPDRTTSRTINLSTRAAIAAGGGPMIAGLVVDGPAARTVLVRGIGPTLAQFGVPGTLSDPQLRIIAQNGATIATNDNWATATTVNGRTVDPGEIRAAAAACGAFDLVTSSKDAALLVTLAPGNYTLQVSGTSSSDSGVALVEAYDVPAGASGATLPLSPVDGTFEFSGGLSGAPAVAFEQPDGRILVGGGFTVVVNGRTLTGLTRLEADGAIDATFLPPPVNSGAFIKTIAQQADGKILIGGTFTSLGGVPARRIARLNLDGSLDPTFASALTDSVNQIVVQPDGRVIHLPAFGRLNRDGSVDSTWRGTYPAAVFGPGTQISLFTSSPQRLALRNGDQFILAARYTLPTWTISNIVIAAARTFSVAYPFNADGTRGTTPSELAYSAPIYSPTVLDLLVLPDGRLIEAGSSEGSAVQAGAIASDGSKWLAGTFTSFGGAARIHLARFSTNGPLASFKLASGFQDAAGAPSPPTALLALRNGDVLALGNFTRVDGVLRRQIARLHPE